MSTARALAVNCRAAWPRTTRDEGHISVIVNHAEQIVKSLTTSPAAES
jgi:hypothetical protein